MSDYYIDFERINQLTSSPYDGSDESGWTGNKFAYSVSRKIIQQYLEIYTQRDSRMNNPEKVKEAIKQLKFNKILLDESDIRDNKLSKLLDDEVI